MKKLYRIILVALAAVSMSACQSYFLEKPDTTGTVDSDAVYGSKKNATMALMACYRDVLLHGWPGDMGIGHCTFGAISGEVGRGYNWHGSYFISQSGLTVNGTDGSDAGADNYANNFKRVRECWALYEHIDECADMTDAEKATIKAEAKALVAYRYMGMFYRYGGVPIVEGTFQASDDLTRGRATVAEMVEFISRLCDEAAEGLPTKWDDANIGRINKGAALAIKARVLQYAARPLFNSATPYLSMANAENNAMICFGNVDKERWNAAIAANEAVLSWADAAGFYLIDTDNPFVDYATATSVPSNPEVILAFKNNQDYNALSNFINCSPNQNSNRYDTDCSGVLTNMLENYYAADGTELSWPKIGDAAPRAGANWISNVAKIEPRALADIKFGGHDAMNNEGIYNWQNIGWSRGGYSADIDKGDVFPNAIDENKGCGERCKFYYKAGSRLWFEPPLFRMAEIYLNLAEAYNEYGNSAKALQNLNKVHERAGLPAVRETDQAKLRQIIQREYYIELFQENGNRYFASKHWKREDIGSGICGGAMRMLQFNIKPGSQWPYAASTIDTYWDAVAYNSFWSPAMFLEPFPQSEINKGTLVQNPGY